MYRETLAKYFLRLGIKMPDPLRADAELLKELHYAHCTHIPVENADIIRNIPLSLDPVDIYRKVIDGRRGGNSFELNCLFGWLLRELGYSVSDFSARYLRGTVTYPMRCCRVLKVTAPEGSVWYCDVGCGEKSPLYPVKMEEDLEQVQHCGTYKFRKHRFLGWRLMELEEGEWNDICAFTEEPQLPEDFIPLCFYCEKHPDSPYIKEERFSLKTETGMISLQGHIYRELINGEVSEKICTDEEMSWAYSRFGLKY